MDKVKLEIKIPEKVIINYNGVDIEIIPFLTIAQEAFLIQKYIEDYFGNPTDILINGTRYHYLEAETKLKNYLIQLITNIEIEDLDVNIYSDSVLWNKIEDEILNYYDFEMKLYKVVNSVKQEENIKYSIGSVISNLVDKANAFIEKMEDMDPDKLKEAGEKGLELVERLEKTSILKNPADIAEIVNPVEASVKRVTAKKTRKPRTKKVVE